MAALVCDLCGGKLVMGAGGTATCDSCGMEHSPDRMREKVQEIKGVVQADSSHLVSNYLDMAINAVDAGNNEEAEAYCNKIIEVDPTNYRAWMLKGEAAAWQSSLANSRISEGVNAFAKGVNYAPESEKEEVVEQAKNQIKNLCIAMVGLRTDRFAKWPDEEETTGLVAMLTTVLSTVVDFLAQTGALVSLEDIMGPVATKINQAVVQAYQKVIYPEYKSERYPYPDDDDFRKFIKRIGYCTTLVEKAIALCDSDDEDDIQRYENLIFLHNKAIESCSYDSQYADLDEQWKVNMYASKPGLHPVARENRVYFKSLSLNDSAVSSRRRLIAQYEAKIREIKAEKERIAKEEAQKRFDEYWAAHAEEKANLENERTELNKQITGFNREIKQIPGDGEIKQWQDTINHLSAEKASLGLFKGKEKKAIQVKIDDANAEIKKVQDRMAAAKAEIQKKITPLQNRVNSITTELTKAR